MAKIFLSYSSKDADFARLLAEKLKTGGHEVAADFDLLTPGQNWRSVLSGGLKEADALVALVSQASLSSQFTLMEIGSARAYSSEIGKPLVIPVLIDDTPIPIALQDIQVLFAPDRNTDRILSEINRALSISAGQMAAKQQKLEDTARKIEANATTYIEDAVSIQKVSQIENNSAGKFWYAIGFAALLLGIVFALYSLFYRPAPSNLIALGTVLVTNVIVIGFLGACSRYAFSLGKSYISESLKSADRIHAIAFGKFYLRAFGEKATWSELKEVFQYWNIDRASTFSSLDVSQIDPQILALIAQMSRAIGGKAKTKDKD